MSSPIATCTPRSPTSRTGAASTARRFATSPHLPARRKRISWCSSWCRRPSAPAGSSRRPTASRPPATTSIGAWRRDSSRWPPPTRIVGWSSTAIVRSTRWPRRSGRPSSPTRYLEAVTADPWAGIVGQTHAIEQLQAAGHAPVHAYLLVGPRGSGKRSLARAFAGALLAATAASDPDRAVRLALAGRHPDLHEFERAGPYITVEQADAIIRESSRSGVESDRKVLVLVDFHLVQAAVEGKLLKSIEEPAGDTVFVVLAESVPTLLEPIASRCVRIDVDPLPESIVVGALVASGVDADIAAEVAVAAAGD